MVLIQSDGLAPRGANPSIYIFFLISFFLWKGQVFLKYYLFPKSRYPWFKENVFTFFKNMFLVGWNQKNLKKWL